MDDVLLPAAIAAAEAMPDAAGEVTVGVYEDRNGVWVAFATVDRPGAAHADEPTFEGRTPAEARASLVAALRARGGESKGGAS